MISTPGATTSGLIRSSLVGPEPEKLAMRPFASVAPRVMTFTPSPGESIRPGGKARTIGTRKKYTSSLLPLPPAS